MRKHIENTGPQGMDQYWSDPLVMALLPAVWAHYKHSIKTSHCDESARGLLLCGGCCPPPDPLVSPSPTTPWFCLVSGRERTGAP